MKSQLAAFLLSLLLEDASAPGPRDTHHNIFKLPSLPIPTLGPNVITQEQKQPSKKPMFHQEQKLINI